MPKDYMGEILLRKGLGQLDDDLRSGTVTGFWERLKPSLQLEIEKWNGNCDIYGLGTTRIRFYPDPFILEQMKGLAERAMDSPVGEALRAYLEAPDLGGSPLGSVCAETVSHDVTGSPNMRLYVWLTSSAPHQIKYCYGLRPNYAHALVLPITLQAGAIVLEKGQDETSLIGNCIRTILQPLMDAA